MAKLLTAVMGLCILAGAAYVATRPKEASPPPPPRAATSRDTPAPQSEAARRLDQFRHEARRIEDEQQKRLDGVLEQTEQR